MPLVSVTRYSFCAADEAGPCATLGPVAAREPSASSAGSRSAGRTRRSTSLIVRQPGRGYRRCDVAAPLSSRQSTPATSNAPATGATDDSTIMLVATDATDADLRSCCCWSSSASKSGAAAWRRPRIFPAVAHSTSRLHSSGLSEIASWSVGGPSRPHISTADRTRCSWGVVANCGFPDGTASGYAHVAAGERHRAGVPVVADPQPVPCRGVSLPLDDSDARRRLSWGAALVAAVALPVLPVLHVGNQLSARRTLETVARLGHLGTVPIACDPGRVGWAVNGVARVLRMRNAACLARSQLIWLLLSWCGQRPVIRVGAGPGLGAGTMAHAWVEVDGVPVADRGDVALLHPPFDGPLLGPPG
jgi:hypothetical protein